MPRIKLTLKSKLYCNAFPHVINTKLKNKYKDRNQNKNNRLVSFKKNKSEYLQHLSTIYRS